MLFRFVKLCLIVLNFMSELVGFVVSKLFKAFKASSIHSLTDCTFSVPCEVCRVNSNLNVLSHY